jgi:hypothetical protein
MDPHYFEKPDADPHPYQSEEPDPDPRFNEKNGIREEPKVHHITARLGKIEMKKRLPVNTCTVCNYKGKIFQEKNF